MEQHIQTARASDLQSSSSSPLLPSRAFLPSRALCCRGRICFSSQLWPACWHMAQPCPYLHSGPLFPLCSLYPRFPGTTRDPGDLEQVLVRLGAVSQCHCNNPTASAGIAAGLCSTLCKCWGSPWSAGDEIEAPCSSESQWVPMSPSNESLILIS